MAQENADESIARFQPGVDGFLPVGEGGEWELRAQVIQ